ncbi:hypothetical protein QOT17_003163 [Balamuthia mandrillaris]
MSEPFDKLPKDQVMINLGDDVLFTENRFGITSVKVNYTFWKGTAETVRHLLVALEHVMDAFSNLSSTPSVKNQSFPQDPPKFDLEDPKISNLLTFIRALEVHLQDD